MIALSREHALRFNIRHKQNKMSSNNSEAAADTCCASGGTQEAEDINNIDAVNLLRSTRALVTSVAIAYDAAKIKTNYSEAAAVVDKDASCGTELKKCDGCDRHEDHRPEREVKCKERAAELRDEILFRLHESSHLGDCPICCLPLSFDPTKYMLQTCCSKHICIGCSYTNDQRQIRKNMYPICAFCRHPLPKTKKEYQKNLMKRVAANDPVALNYMGCIQNKEGDYERAFKYYTKAAELGDVNAHFNLSLMYRKGEGVEIDRQKEWYHLEESFIRGHPDARFNRACYEERAGRIDRAVKHFIIASNLGHDQSIRALKVHYKRGDISKDDFAAALRAHQAVVDATKSPQREEAAKVLSKHQFW